MNPSQDWIGKWANLLPDQLALKDAESGQEMSYAQLNRVGNHVAYLLIHELGLQSGDRIAVLAEWSIAYVAMFVAVQKTGCVLVPLNYRLTAPELAYILEDSAPSLLIADEECSSLLEAAASEKSVGSLEAFMAIDTQAPEREWPELPEDHPLFILYTSGTTGRPKGAIYTHKMLFWNSINTALGLLINSEARTVNVMPPFHTGGWNVLLTPLLHHGGYTCLVKKFDAEKVLRLLESEQPTIFMGVPTMLSMMGQSEYFEKADLSTLHYIIVGGEAMPVPLIEQWHEKGIAIRQGYGMTEVGPNLTSLHQSDAIRKRGSIGKPNFYVQTRIVNDRGESVLPGESGELLIQGPMVTPGYWRSEEASLASRSGAWFRTGDMASQDEDGYLYIVDRIKNMFISGGENVYPAEVERVLIQLEGVEEAAVIGVPDPKWGESGAAFVVLNKDCHTSVEELKSACRQQLAKFKVPQHIRFVEGLPKNDTGKINRQALRNLL